ncbi:phage virion morphogenesis protein [Methylobacter sp.]|uniref:phage virion morphogenesis protein n=1 Tax=Methylobacter sp. TaxID=2051955 RepID=UPI0024878AEF|nr:phage virion morphogenesis protein [Methylobacter sp.]MDI1278026.1 phage virion morphogenesis protein [Methylobacter sp.]
MAEVEWDDHEVLMALQNLQQAVGDLRPALADIGDKLIESTKQRFSTKTGPDGQQWKENSPITINFVHKFDGFEWMKGRDDPLIGRSDMLQKQIHYNLIGTDALEVGSPMEYAAMQQFGGKKSEFPKLFGDIPARSFLGISDDDKNYIFAIINRHLANAIR